MNVVRLLWRRLDIAKTLHRERLDPSRGGRARQLREQPCVVRTKTRAVATELVEPQVQAQHGDVHGHDACEERGERPDPEHAAGDPALGASTLCRARPRADLDVFDPSGSGPAGHQRVFTPARRRAEDARGFAASSRADGRIALRGSARNSGSRPQIQTGKSGGHSQPRSRSRMKRFTIRSSSEWKAITAMRPPGRSIANAAGSAASSEPSSSLTAMRSAWNTRLAG